MSGATIRVQFGDDLDASAHLSAEMDDREGGPNEGKTRFLPGDTAWFLVFRSAGVEVTTTASAGSVIPGDEVSFVREVELTFEDTATARLPVPAQAVLGCTWYGRSLGQPVLAEDQMTLRLPRSGVAVAKVTYRTKALSFGLKSPAALAGEVDFSILVLVKGTAAAKEGE